MKMRFTCDALDENRSTMVELKDVGTWTEALEAFADFLRASGFVFDGHFDLVDDEPTLLHKGVK